MSLEESFDFAQRVFLVHKLDKSSADSTTLEGSTEVINTLMFLSTLGERFDSYMKNSVLSKLTHLLSQLKLLLPLIQTV